MYKFYLESDLLWFEFAYTRFLCEKYWKCFKLIIKTSNLCSNNGVMLNKFYQTLSFFYFQYTYILLIITLSIIQYSLYINRAHFRLNFYVVPTHFVPHIEIFIHKKLNKPKKKQKPDDLFFCNILKRATQSTEMVSQKYNFILYIIWIALFMFNFHPFSFFFFVWRAIMIHSLRFTSWQLVLNYLYT